MHKSYFIIAKNQFKTLKEIKDNLSYLCRPTIASEDIDVDRFSVVSPSMMELYDAALQKTIIKNKNFKSF